MSKRTRRLGLLVVLLVGVGSIGLRAWQQRVPGPPAATATKVSWEYQVLSEAAPGGGTPLRGYGSNGWELVSVINQTEYSGNTSRTQTYYYLKRQVSQ